MYGDYSELRHQMLGALSVDELLGRMRAAKGRSGRADGKAKAPAKRATRPRARRRAT
jgi:hypothetical protein